MARRKQLKGIAGNLVQWCLSRSFDYEGYWAIGKLYEYADAKGVYQDTHSNLNGVSAKHLTSKGSLALRGGRANARPLRGR